MNVKILILTRYGRLGASSRLRSLQYLPFFEKNGIEYKVEPLISNLLLERKYKTGRYGFMSLIQAYCSRFFKFRAVKEFDLVWIEKEAFPWMPYVLEKLFLKKTSYILDYDDAVFHNYDLHCNFLVRFFFGKKHDNLMKYSTLVTGGNSYLTHRAKEAGATWIENLPTVIELQRYQVVAESLKYNSPTKIVWIGSPTTVKYLYLLESSFIELAKKFDFELHVIGGNCSMPGVKIKCHPWQEDTEASAIATCDIGIMPLLDSPWEKGKCGYKLIQYMACGLPVVASAIGANCDIVDDGQNGFLASSPDEWFTALSSLLGSPALRQKMGRIGRSCVENRYCLERTGPRFVELLNIAVERKQCAV